MGGVKTTIQGEPSAERQAHIRVSFRPLRYEFLPAIPTQAELGWGTRLT
jgi:hypothetical protein